jgi:hypothetical protein
MLSSQFPTLGALIVSFLAAIGRAQRPDYLNYTTLTGYFMQDDPATNPSTFDYVNDMSSDGINNC